MIRQSDEEIEIEIWESSQLHTGINVSELRSAEDAT
jgi:hypothetical protein